MINLEDFLYELTLLSKKYGVLIGGCGCCNSPFIEEIDDTLPYFCGSNGHYECENILYSHLSWEKGEIPDR